MHGSRSLTVVLGLGDAFVPRGPLCLSGGAEEAGELGREEPTPCASGAADDYCPKASSLGSVGAKSGLRVAEDILDLFR